MGGRGGTSGINNVHQKISDKIESIRNSKHENLLVFDKNGNLVHSEGGTAGHTGYSTVDYADKITAHNHPKGYAPYPSEKDISTFQSSGAKEMIIVSKDYTVRLRKDPSYKSLSGVRGDINQAIRWMGGNTAADKIRQDVREGKYSRKEGNEKIRQIKFDQFKKAAKRSGYIFEVVRKR